MSTASVVLEPTPSGTVATSELSRWRRSRWLRGLSALLAGVVTGLAWEPYGFWPLLFVGIPAFTLLVFGAPLRQRARPSALGYLFGLAMLGVPISWIHVLGVGRRLLIAFEALFFAMLGLALHLVRVAVWPLAAACCWVLIEFAVRAGPVRRLRLGAVGLRRGGHAAAGFFPSVSPASPSWWPWSLS